MSTTNAFIFSWDRLGIEAIIPITQYEDWDLDNMAAVLRGEDKKTNPLSGIIFRLTMRARHNTHRNYEIYAIDCDPSMDEEYWKQQWKDNPQFCADLVRQRGVKIYSDRADPNQDVIR